MIPANESAQSGCMWVILQKPNNIMSEQNVLTWKVVIFVNFKT